MRAEPKHNFNLQHAPAAKNNLYPIAGKSDAVLALRQMSALSSGSDSPLLITGPHGCGKEYIARHIHANSSRANSAFIKFDCSRPAIQTAPDMPVTYKLPAETLPGGNANLESADGGTLFIDHADEMSIDIQTLILQLIEQHPDILGGTHGLKPLNIRVIAATSGCLATLVHEGTFLERLYDRLQRLTLPVPTLRQRRDDIDLLVNQYLSQKAPSERFIVNWAARETLRGHLWPGNIRELHNVLSRACIFHPGETIEAHRMQSIIEMGQPLRAGPNMHHAHNDDPPLSAGFNLKTHLQGEERRFITSALQQANGVVQHAAKLIGIKRTTFIEKMHKYGIERRRFKR